MKFCKFCQTEKPETEFYRDKNNNLSTYCIECTKIKNKEYKTNNKEKIRIHDLEYYRNNKDKKALKDKRHYEKYKKEINIKNREYMKERRKNDQEYNMKCRLRKAFNLAINKHSKTGKIQNSKKYGINFEEIINHLGPCPGNREDYHIDHIFPISAFNHNDQIEIKACWNPGNLQWLIKHENLKKNNKYDKEEFKKYLKKFKAEEK